MRTNLLKTMLVAVGLAASVGAWADDITATLSHTAGTRYGSAAGSTANTVDGEAEYYNNEGSKGWIGYAFAEFSFTIPEGQSVTSASLTWTASSSKTYGSTIYYLNSGTTLDYDAIKTTQSNYRFNGAKTQILTAESVKGSKTITTDVTDAVKDIAASQSYIIFQWTNNNGSATLAGKASSNAPVLTITTASASDMTTYTVKFVDESNNSIKADVSYDVAVNTSTTATDEDLASFFNSDKSKKYIYKSGNNAITTVSEAASNVITLVFREANKWNYSVNAVDENSTVLKTYTSGEDFEQETFSTPFNKYIVVDGTIYSTSNEKTGAWFKKSATLDSNDKTVSISYKKGSENIVYFKEAEEIEGLTATSDGNADIRCSNGQGAYNASDEAVTITTLSAGTYKLTAGLWGSGTNILINYGETENWEIALKGYFFEESKEIVLTKETTITMPKCGSNSKCLDYIIIQKTGEASQTISITSAGYATAVTSYKVTIPENVKAYAVTVNDDATAATLNELSGVIAAGTAILVKGDEGSYEFPVSTEEATTIEKNDLVAATADVTADGKQYALAKKTDGVGFYKVKEGVSIPAGKAYLVVNSAEAKAFYGFGGETTGINSLNAAATVGNAKVYNLNGQLVGKSLQGVKKGVYIVNGKKTVKN